MADAELERVKFVAKVLDTYYVDPVLGAFLPGIGDVLGALMGMYIVVIAGKRGVSPVVIARMLMNLALDMAVGAIPIVGDAADFVFKANKMNVALLIDRDSRGGKSSWKDWAALIGAIAVVIGVIVGVVYVFIRLLEWLF